MSIRKSKLTFAICSTLMLFAGQSLAKEPVLVDKMYLDLNVPGGLGFGVGKSISDKLGVRGQYNFLKYDDTTEETGTTYKLNYKASQVGIFGDYFVFGGTFRLTGGVGLLGNDINLEARGTGQAVDIGGRSTVLGPNDFVSLSIKMPDVAPYLGFGFGHALGKSFYLSSDLGVHFGSLKTGIQVSDNVRRSVGDAAVENERRNIENDFADFDLIPSASVSVGYRF